MCVVSAVGDYWKDKVVPNKYPTIPLIPDYIPAKEAREMIGREEFDELKKDVEELKKLLIAAKRFDEKVEEPDCETDDKVALIKKIAKLVGVDMKEVFNA